MPDVPELPPFVWLKHDGCWYVRHCNSCHRLAFRRLIMKASIFLIIIVSLQVFVSGQDAPPPPITKIVMWGDGASCQPLDFDLGPNDSLKFALVIVDGHGLRTISFNGIAIAAKLYYLNDYDVIDVFIANRTGNRILVDPRKWAHTQHRSREHFINAKPLMWERPADPAKIAEKIASRTAWANAFAALGAGFATQKATVTHPDGSQSTVTAPDTSAQRRAAVQNRQRTTVAQSEAAEIMDTALLANTVFDQGSVDGLVYFKRDKKAYFSVMEVRIGGVRFWFASTKAAKK